MNKVQVLLAKTENKTVVGIPESVRTAEVTIEPQTIIIVFNVEDVEVAIRISNV